MSLGLTERQPLILLGAGGHAKVLLSLAHSAERSVIGVCDSALMAEGVTRWRGLAVLGGDDALANFSAKEVGLVNGVGQVIGSYRRQQLFAELIKKQFKFPTLIHSTAWVDHTVHLEQGVQVMAGAILQADTRVGLGTIVNTGATVDHDCVVGEHVHIAPGATICGNVYVGNGGFVGSGAVVIQGLNIGENAVVGAGVVLTRDLMAGEVILGPSMRKRPYQTS